MNSKQIYRVIFLVIIVQIMGMTFLSAQNLCTEKLSKAEIQFEAGHLYEIYELIEECINNGFSKEERIRAYRLLTITYLYIDEHEKADETYLSLLKLSPEYKPNSAIDPVELFYLHNKFITTPRWSFILSRIGLNLSLVRPYNLYTTDGYRNGLYELENVPTQTKEYVPGAGLTIGTGIKYGYSNRLSVTGELLMKLNRYKINENILGHTTVVFNEDQYNVEVPVLLNYTFHEHKLKPYFFGGGSLNMLVASSAKNIKLERKQGTTVLPETGPNISMTRNRNRFGFSAIVGCGIQYKIGVNYLNVELRHTFGLKNISSTNNRYNNPEMLYRYMYVDDDMRLDNSMISISYVKPFYNPRKKK